MRKKAEEIKTGAAVPGACRGRRGPRMLIPLLVLGVALMSFVCLFVGSSNLSVSDCVDALLKRSTAANNRIIWNIRS